jgi:methyl-accepting chemotaxis protein
MTNSSLPTNPHDNDSEGPNPEEMDLEATHLAATPPPSKRTIALRTALVLPFLLQIFGAVGITGYLSIRNGQQTVSDLATKIEKSSSKQIEQQLEAYLPLVPKLAKINADAVHSGNLNLQNLTQVGQVFCSQMQNFSVGYASFGTPQGDYIGVERLDNGKLVINEQSARTNGKLAVFPATETCDRGPMSEAKDGYVFAKENWYSDTVKAKKPVWSSIYNWEDKPNVMSVSFNTPLYSADNKLQAVMGGDFILSQLSEFLKKLEISPNARVFLIERNGGLIASSADQQPFKLVNQKAQRLNAEESSDAVVRDAAAYLKQKFDGFEAIGEPTALQAPLQGQNHYLNITPWKDPQGLDWLIVMAIPENDFLGTVAANTRQTIFLCIAALIGASALGLWTSRWILGPIRSLNEAADALAHGGEEVALPESNITELNLVSRSFSDMDSRLRDLLSQLQSDNQNLGAQVAEQSQALGDALKRIRDKQDNSAKQHRDDRAKLANLSTQIGYPVNSMQDELGNAQENLSTILAELLNYREQIKQLPAEFRQEVSSADLDILISDLQKRVIIIAQGSDRIGDLSGNLKRHIAQIQQS